MGRQAGRVAAAVFVQGVGLGGHALIQRQRRGAGRGQGGQGVAVPAEPVAAGGIGGRRRRRGPAFQRGGDAVQQAVGLVDHDCAPDMG